MQQISQCFSLQRKKIDKRKTWKLLLMSFLDVFPNKYSNKSMSYRDLRLLFDDGEFNKTGKL